jgi:uncharacterized membrane protein YkoI
MKLMTVIGSSLALSFSLAVACGGSQTKASDPAASAKLEAEAKVSRPDAEKAALAAVPGGTIKEGELEREHGVLVWSFDIATAGSEDITEVQIDAANGKVVSVEKETPKQQREEKEKDKKK